MGLLARRAEALMDSGAAAEALEVADEAMALAVEHDLAVDRTDLTSILARLSETSGDPRESIRRLEGAVAAWTRAPDLALLRAMDILASVHFRQGDHEAALAAFERTVAEARRAGLEWSMYGVDARAMVVTTAYEMGDWDRAASAADTRHRGGDAGLGGGQHRRRRRWAARGPRTAGRHRAARRHPPVVGRRRPHGGAVRDRRGRPARQRR